MPRSAKIALRRIPSVGKLLDHPRILAVRADHSHAKMTAAIRAVLQEQRRELLENAQNDGQLDLDVIAEFILQRLAEPTEHFREVINATGLVLHTNLGRSPMSERAAWAAYSAARRYLNLELSLASGNRLVPPDRCRSSDSSEQLCRCHGDRDAGIGCRKGSHRLPGTVD
jgi:L-seryl-tRNA(Ser) seleniumtransferase